MDAAFRRNVAVGKIPFHEERRRFDARLFSRLVVQHLGGVPGALTPSEVHPDQHLRPILRIDAAGPGMNRDDRVGSIMFSGEQHADFRVLGFLFQLLHLACELGQDVLALLRQFDKRFQIARHLLSAWHPAGYLAPGGSVFAGSTALLPDCSRIPAGLLFFLARELACVCVPHQRYPRTCCIFSSMALTLS